jgi:hypothetical protein
VNGIELARRVDGEGREDGNWWKGFERGETATTKEEGQTHQPREPLPYLRGREFQMAS